MDKEKYLGDGLYVTDEAGYQFVLWTKRAGGTHFVALNDEVFESLLRFVECTRHVKITVTRATADEVNDSLKGDE